MELVVFFSIFLKYTQQNSPIIQQSLLINEEKMESINIDNLRWVIH